MIGLRVTEGFKDFLQGLADQENRTLSNFILNAILTHIHEKKGLKWEEETRRQGGRKGTSRRKKSKP